VVATVSSSVQIRMLGSFEVRTDDGVFADVPGARLRGLLIALALEAGHAVPKATLVEWIWGERPPAEAANALQRLVSRLRKALPEGLVEGQTDGYRLRVEPNAVDAVRFEGLVGQARNDEDPRRLWLLREALALWRGAAMQDVGLQDSAAFDAAVTRLEGLRLTAMEDRFDAEVALGHGAELVTELTEDALLGGTPNAAPADRLIAAIRERETLLILDNCEHVIESAAAFAHRVLGECRRLRILATSREPLGITGEALWLVEQLALPAEDADPGEIESSPAVQLLRDRAGAVRKDLAITAQLDGHTLSNMARVCRALDGIPLAIELAAARLRTMPLDQLASRLDDRFRLLTGGSRTALPRHRTLRAVVDWSWELLTDAERMVLRRLAVFSGGASLDAAERVCVGDSVEQEQVLELLTALTEKSLLLTEGDSAPRYRTLGTIKEYARDRLAETGESDLARHVHLAYFTELAEAAEPHLRRAEQLEWLATLEAEHDNIAVALRGALAVGEAHPAMRLAAGAGWYWWLGGHKAEGIELLVAATNAPGEVSDEIRAWVYALVVMFMTDGPGDQHQAEEWIHNAYRFPQRSQHPQPATGVRRRAGAHVAGAGRVLARVRTTAGRRGPVGTRTGPAAARQDADHARPGRAGCGCVSRDGARRVPGARRAVGDFVRSDRARGPNRHARRVRPSVRALRPGDRGRHRSRCYRGDHPDAVAAGAAVLAAG